VVACIRCVETFQNRHTGIDL